MSIWQPWHWPTDISPQSQLLEFSRSLEGHTNRWMAHLCPASIEKDRSQIFLSLSCAQNDLFCLCDSQGQLATTHTPLAPWQIRTSCADAFTHSKIARLYFLNSSGQLRKQGETAFMYVVVRADGTGVWKKWPPDKTECVTQFRLFDESNLQNFIARSELEMWHELQNALCDLQSETTFVRDWTLKTEAEREDVVWNWPRSQREQRRREFQESLLCALLAQEELWQGADVWDCSLSSPDSVTLCGGNDLSEHPVPPSLQNAINCLWHHFAPFNEAANRHLCVRTWKKWKSDFGGGSSPHWNVLSAGKRQPSAHERLEAALRWRDWLASAQPLEEL